MSSNLINGRALASRVMGITLTWYADTRKQGFGSYSQAYNELMSILDDLRRLSESPSLSHERVREAVVKLLRAVKAGEASTAVVLKNLERLDGTNLREFVDELNASLSVLVRRMKRNIEKERKAYRARRG